MELMDLQSPTRFCHIMIGAAFLSLLDAPRQSTHMALLEGQSWQAGLIWLNWPPGAQTISGTYIIYDRINDLLLHKNFRRRNQNVLWILSS